MINLWPSLYALAAASPVVSTVVLLLLGVGLHWAVTHVFSGLDEGRHPWQQKLRTYLGIDSGRRIPELRWVALIYPLLLWPVIGLLLLHVWGKHDWGDQLYQRFLAKGFQVGGNTVVPIKLLLGLVLFIFLFTFTRWLRTRLENQWLVLMPLEASLRTSVATLFGYVTFLLAMLLGLSAAGLDLSKLAIVAGALSVGIGFGLQNIFNNFVSGLILLFERPIRTGDYIAVAGVSGVVKKIRIRATEIETGDRTSIIIPNAVLISGQVENSNYRDNLGRVAVEFWLELSADLDTLKPTLLALASAHPQVLAAGSFEGVLAPSLRLVEISSKGLRLELKAYIRDMNLKGVVASDWRELLLKQHQQGRLPLLVEGMLTTQT
jgi:small-conductance mechanosensitive channel